MALDVDVPEGAQAEAGVDSVAAKPQDRSYKELYTQKSCRILIKSNRNHVVFTIFYLIWNQTDVR